MQTPELWTPELQRLTTEPEKQLISDFWSVVLEARMDGQPAYRPDLYYHNYAHIFHEGLPAVLTLMARDSEENTPRNRRIAIGAMMAHDMWSTLRLDKEEFFNVENRTIAWARPLIEKFFATDEIEEIDGGIDATSPQGTCETPNQKKVRRADLGNLNEGRVVVPLSTTVRVFGEEVQLAKERGEQYLHWTKFLNQQVICLGKLLEVDLTIADETKRKGEGPFNREAKWYVRLLETKHAIRQPHIFVPRFAPYLRPLIPDFNKLVPYIKGEAVS